MDASLIRYSKLSGLLGGDGGNVFTKPFGGDTLYAIYNNTCTRVDLSVINRICKALDCQPGDLMIYEVDKN
ncbi:MAG: helix-turn-helix domain-containing protein [Bacteroidota bacterium]